jgi:hypothetical protein
MKLKKIFSYAPSCLVALLTLLSPVLVSAQSQTNQVGQWAALTQLPFFPVHNHLLPNGKVMMWPGDAGISGNDPRSWDPADQTVTILAKPGYDLFCSGHAFLANGRLFVAGGHIQNGVGVAKGGIYNPFADSWAATPDMNAGRWYPTVTTLANGDVLVVSGDVDSTVGVNQLPQVYQAATGTWRSLTSAQLSQDLYPVMFLAPNGKVINVGPTRTTRYLDTAGTGTWSVIGTRINGVRDYGSAVMYADGKILVLGGGDPPTNTAEVIDLNQPSPTWRQVAPMAYARRQTNATLLPDGTVLVTGGTSGAGFNDATHAVYAAELWNPATETWTTLASSGGIPRIYHSAAILLPDGRVLTTGGNNQPQPEAFSPPYLFKGARPLMSAVPSTFGYGQHFSVQTPDAANITKVTLIRITSVTHAFNANQRLNVLSFTPGSGALDIAAPGNANIAPPGHYLLFLVNSSGVPSLGSIVTLGVSAPATLSSLSPSGATAGGPAFTLKVNGTGFLSGSTVRWNGANRTTTFVNSSQLSAAIPATDIATAGTAQITALNPGTSASNALPFTITSATPTKYTLTVAKSGTAASKGTVTSSSGGINCGTACSSSFDSGAVVTLSARVIGNAVFSGWSGACSGTGTCTVTMDATKAVTATFNRR